MKPNQTNLIDRKEPTSVQMQDLESALHYSFRQEIGMRSRLTAGDLVIVKNYVRVLAKVRMSSDSEEEKKSSFEK